MIRKFVNKGMLLVLIMFCGQASAQSYKNKADIDTILHSDFYAFSITPELSSLVKTDFRDLRIRDQKGNPVPYLIAGNIPVLRPDFFKPLKIVKNYITDSGRSVLIIENFPHESMDGFYIRIRNAAVSRTMSLSGSQNGMKWYSIIEDVNFERHFIQDRDSFLEKISFPLSSYQFYRVIIYNRKNDPLDIISIQKRISTEKPEAHNLVQNPSMSFIRKDSSKITWLTIANPKYFHISNFGIYVKSPHFFKRQVDILKGGFLAGNFTISSDSVFHLSLPVFNDSVFTVKIYNEDNPPLDITGISTAQEAEKIITYLDSGKSYQLEMTNSDATAPHYDLINFKDRIPEKVKQINILHIGNRPALQAGNENTRFKKGWLWLSLIGVIIVLGLFTYRLAKDVSKRS